MEMINNSFSNNEKSHTCLYSKNEKKNAANLNFLNYHVLEYMQMQIIALPCYLQKIYGLVDQMVSQKRKKETISFCTFANVEKNEYRQF